jgi:pyridoxine kinase
MILSIQSHVAYGYVGNRAAVFPLQRLGFDVTTINTVQFSNHTGYGSWTGDIFTPEHIRSLIKGLRDRDVLKDVTAVLSGYLGAADLGQIVLDTVSEIRALNPSLVYCCDPVMGDVGRGMFVKPDIPPFFRDQAIPQSTIITPNQFELSWLTEVEIVTLADAVDACHSLIRGGSKIVLLTSLLHDKTPDDKIEMLVVTESGEAFTITTPRLPFDIPPNGSGDATAALFLGHYLKTGSVQMALERTATAIFAVFEATHARGHRELALIEAQNSLLAEPQRFTAIPLKNINK